MIAAYLYRLSKRATLSTLLYLSTSTISFWCVIVKLLLLLLLRVRCKSYQQFGFYCPPARSSLPIIYPLRTIGTEWSRIFGDCRVFTDFFGLSGGVGSLPGRRLDYDDHSSQSSRRQATQFWPTNQTTYSMSNAGTLMEIDRGRTGSIPVCLLEYLALSCLSVRDYSCLIYRFADVFLGQRKRALTCLLKIEISSLNDSEEHTSPPWTPGSRGVHVASSHFSNISASRGNNGCLERKGKKTR